jgi:hypothetical protein
MDEWEEETRIFAGELEPKLFRVLGGEADIEVQHWAYSRESFLTLVLFEEPGEVPLATFIRDIRKFGYDFEIKDVKEYGFLSFFKALQKRGWLSVQGEQLGLNEGARRAIERITSGKKDFWLRRAALDEWMMHNPAEPFKKE